jgi:hypothetical protein
MARIWTIQTYVRARGTDAIEEWGVSAGALATFDAALEYLAQRAPIDWERPEYAPLHGNASGLSEIRFKHGGIQYRPLGFVGPLPLEFTILLGASKKGNVWTPHSAIDTALRRKDEVLADRSTIRPYEF